MSPCVKGGKLHCVNCHTSSGRYRFKKEKVNNACLPCHEERVKNVAAHSHHPAESEGEQVHLLPHADDRIRPHAAQRPLHAAADAGRDHRLPVPQRLQRLPRGQGCRLGRQTGPPWRQRDYQAPVLKRAALIDAARKRDWTKLPEMLAYIGDPKSDEIFATSLIRLLAHCDDPAKVPVLQKALGNPSPLVRGAAVEGLGQSPTLEVLQDIAAATGDDYRLVRVRAAAAMAQFPNMKPQGKAKEKLDKATEEYLAALMARPDSWDAHYNLGNYYLGQNRPKEALVEYDIAYKHEPQSVLTLVNAAMAHAKLGETARAEEKLNAALKIAPDSGAARFNLGLIKAELGDLPAAEKNLKEAFRIDPQLAGAAFNLCIITATDRPAEALDWCRKASTLRPQEPKYAWTLAFYQQQGGDSAAAVATLDALINRVPGYPDAYLLLAEIHEKQGRKDEAARGLQPGAGRTGAVPEGQEPTSSHGWKSCSILTRQSPRARK